MNTCIQIRNCVTGSNVGLSPDLKFLSIDRQFTRALSRGAPPETFLGYARTYRDLLQEYKSLPISQGRGIEIQRRMEQVYSRCTMSYDRVFSNNKSPDIVREFQVFCTAHADLEDEEELIDCRSILLAIQQGWDWLLARSVKPHQE